MPYRSVAVIRMHDDHPPSRHYVGMPDGGATGERSRLPWPRLLLIVEREDGFYLERLLENGDVVGDTAHDDAAEAREQAEWEYGKFLGQWKDVPDEISEDRIPDFALS
jgi:hypothetical protein